MKDYSERLERRCKAARASVAMTIERSYHLHLVGFHKFVLVKRYELLSPVQVVCRGPWCSK